MVARAWDNQCHTKPVSSAQHMVKMHDRQRKNRLEGSRQLLQVTEFFTQAALH